MSPTLIVTMLLTVRIKMCSSGCHRSFSIVPMHSALTKIIHPTRTEFLFICVSQALSHTVMFNYEISHYALKALLLRVALDTHRHAFLHHFSLSSRCFTGSRIALCTRRLAGLHVVGLLPLAHNAVLSPTSTM